MMMGLKLVNTVVQLPSEKKNCAAPMFVPMLLMTLVSAKTAAICWLLVPAAVKVNAREADGPFVTKRP